MPGLTWRVFLAMTILLVIMLALVIGQTYSAYLRARSIYAERFAVDHTRLMTSGLEVKINGDLLLSQTLALSQITRQYFSGNGDEELRRLFISESEKVRELSPGKRLFYARLAGGEVVINEPGLDLSHEPRYFLDPLNPGDRWFFRLIEDQDEEYELNIDTNRVLSSSNIWINVPVEGEGTRLGVLGTAFPLADFTETFSETEVPGLIPMVVNNDAVIIAHPDSRIVQHNADVELASERILLSDILQTPDSLGVKIETLRRSPGEILMTNGTSNDGAFVLAMSYMEELRWFLISMVILNEVPLPIGRLATQLVLVYSAFLLVFYAVISIIINRLVLRPLSILQNLALRAADGEYHLKIPDDLNDEIGKLAQSFSSLLAKIRAHTGSLEQTIHKRERELRRVQEHLVENRQAITIGNLIMGMSQKINTPLGNALTSADSVKQGLTDIRKAFDDQTMTRSYFEQKLTNAGRLTEIVLSDVRQIIDFMDVLKTVRLDMDNSRVVPVNLYSSIYTLLETLVSSMPERKIARSITIDGNAEIQTIDDALTEMINILLTGILLNSEQDRELNLSISLNETATSEQYELVITDNRQAMSAEDIQQALNPLSYSGVQNLDSGSFSIQLFRANLILKAVLQGSMDIQTAAKDGNVIRITLPKKISKIPR